MLVGWRAPAGRRGAALAGLSSETHMTASLPKRSRTNLSMLIGLWLGLTVMVGVCVFAGLYWALGGGESFAIAGRGAPTSTRVVVTVSSATDTPVPIPATMKIPTQAAVAQG